MRACTESEYAHSKWSLGGGAAASPTRLPSQRRNRMSEFLLVFRRGVEHRARSYRDESLFDDRDHLSFEATLRHSHDTEKTSFSMQEPCWFLHVRGFQPIAGNDNRRQDQRRDDPSSAAPDD